ncbi:hypothetical protein P7C71_g2137, partial [Lecanoromycetidae sp. Uapishka_2]
MDIVDRDLEKAERAASPDRFPPTNFPDGTPVNAEQLSEKPPTNLERQGTFSSGSSASTASGIVREEMA